jgi:GNAT superfamily N-acetyltransferase
VRLGGEESRVSWYSCRERAPVTLNQPMPHGMHIRMQHESDDERVLQIRSDAGIDHRPMDVDFYRRRIAARPEGLVLERYVLERDEEILGIAILDQVPYTPSPSVYDVVVAVETSFRGHGVGGLLWKHIAERASTAGASKLYAYVKEPDRESRSFAERRGFTATGHVDQESVLAVGKAHLDDFEDDERRLAREGIVLRTLEEIGIRDLADLTTHQETFLRAVNDVTNEAAADIPNSESFTSAPYGQFLRTFLNGPGMRPDRTWVALHGERPAGALLLRTLSPTVVSNRFTGVARAYRGRGIARALKVRSVRWAREAGIESMYTGNDLGNTRMVDINVRLGYQFLPANIELVKDLS